MRRTEEEWERHRFPRESQLQSYITRRVNEYRREHGEHVFMFKVADRHRAGISDLLLCVCGEFVAIELKIAANKPTELQKQFLECVRKSSGKAAVVYNWGDFKKVVNPILEHYGHPLF